MVLPVHQIPMSLPHSNAQGSCIGAESLKMLNPAKNREDAMMKKSAESRIGALARHLTAAQPLSMLPPRHNQRAPSMTLL